MRLDHYQARHTTIALCGACRRRPRPRPCAVRAAPAPISRRAQGDGQITKLRRCAWSTTRSRSATPSSSASPSASRTAAKPSGVLVGCLVRGRREPRAAADVPVANRRTAVLLYLGARGGLTCNMKRRAACIAHCRDAPSSWTAPCRARSPRRARATLHSPSLDDSTFTDLALGRGSLVTLTATCRVCSLTDFTFCLSRLKL
jgi:hypothetical protein